MQTAERSFSYQWYELSFPTSSITWINCLFRVNPVILRDKQIRKPLFNIIFYKKYVYLEFFCDKQATIENLSLCKVTKYEIILWEVMPDSLIPENKQILYVKQ